MKYKILHVLKSSLYSGAENVVLTIIKSLQDEYDFAYLSTDGEIRQVLEENDVKSYLVKTYNRTSIDICIRRYKPDIVHAHDFTASVLCASLKSKYGYKLISQLHYDPPWTHKWNWKSALYFTSSSQYDIILGVSRQTLDAMIFSKKLRKKISELRNPINAQEICQKGDAASEERASDIIFVGRLVEQKNPLYFLELVKELRKQLPELKAVMLGSGIMKKECEAYIHSNHLEDVVEMKGFVSNPYAYMKQSRVLCMTSRWEGFGLVAAEANILGVPVVTTRTAGVESFFGCNAVEICDTREMLEERLKSLLTDAEIYHIWKERALIRATQYQLISDFRAELCKIYERLVRLGK